MREKSYDELFFTDDFLFSKIMRDPEIAKGVIKSLLGFKIEKVEYLNSQHTIDEVYNGRGIRLDAYLEGSGKIIDIEMQTRIKKDEGLRMRYYQSIIDVENMSRGATYNDLKETYIVFICLDDPIGMDKPVYHFVTAEKNGGHVLNDKTHKIFYNASAFDKASNLDVKAFLSFIKNHKASDIITYRIQTAIETSKNHQPWRAEYMLWKDQVIEWKEEAREEGLAEGRAEGLTAGRAEGLTAGRAEGRAEGEANATMQIAKNLLSQGIPAEQISKATGLSVEQINQL